ncbi:hypothetical protein NB640_04975 [Oxalobacter vibrioformis]|uniref:Zinc ribbon domain-containing protein n=1 Tax=Oxalobacter vibrioformis TaxID=933080 RepID=A0A9E9M0H5_9BURK|nr:hypothetical protein [Oxalobacter vibrioformis]WAW10990.1 hypothetical protein NB640_04975 [Oxalobacter vibrioformis]
MNTNDIDIREVLEQRADNLSIDEILTGTFPEGEYFQNALKELTNNSLRSLVGPRGCGKTHLMRYAWATCKTEKGRPFAIYVSFNRYFWLEPLRVKHTNAADLFHTWVISLILAGAYESALAWGISSEQLDSLYARWDISKDALVDLFGKLERNQTLTKKLEAISLSLHISVAQAIIDEICSYTGTRFSVLLLDDAAMTLTPDNLLIFLDIVRAIRSKTIAPKVSVYPGTTEYSPRFHVGQDSLAINVWHPVDSDNYSEVMEGIAYKRISGLESISSDVVDLLKYAAFGIPRAFLSMLWEYKRGDFRTVGQAVNSVIQNHISQRKAEYLSLSKKVPKFDTIIRKGEAVLSEMILLVRRSNEKTLPRREKQLVVGVDIEKMTPLVERMFDLLIEAGLVYQQIQTSHGEQRVYARYIPHIAALIDARAFSQKQKGNSPRQIVEALQFKNTKHPIRTRLKELSKEKIKALHLDLPACDKCKTSRISDDQKFCHFCGAQLITPSTFESCLQTPINEVPDLTKWQKKQITETLSRFNTIGDYLAKQNPSAELLTIFGIGPKRTNRIIDVLNDFIDEFLS